jgi:hypothetical protein
MNERIQELWDKAAKSIAAYPSGQNNSWETQVNFIDKFAQLIVQECCQKLENDGMVEVAMEMKQHFGVE